MFNLEELYCCVDDFCQKFIPLWEQQLIENNQLKRHRATSLSPSKHLEMLQTDHPSVQFLLVRRGLYVISIS
ncbi:hypothetical protein WDV76_20340 [Xenorhabdus griffiniae]